jgi:YVTN family beta-propeller protein
VSVINGATNTALGNITVGAGPYGIAYDPSNGCLYVTNYDNATVSVINGTTNTVIGNITVGTDPVGVAYDSSNGYLYVANYGSMSISVVSTATPIPEFPESLAFFTILISVLMAMLVERSLGRHRSSRSELKGQAG